MSRQRRPVHSAVTLGVWGSCRESPAKPTTGTARERNGFSRLTAAQVEEIARDRRGQHAIARDYHVCRAAIGHIKNGVNRKWLTERARAQ